MTNYYYSIPSIFIIHLLICLSCYCIGTTHAIADASLLPNRPSNRPTTISTEANRRRGKGRRRGKVSAIIINRWSPLNKYNNIPVDEQQVLEWDAHRAKSIQARFRARRNEVEKEAPVKLPAIPGSQIKSASFVVQVKIGKIKNDQLLIFDTGSKLTWVQCVSCKPKNCYKQNSTTYFDPIASGSRKIECASGSCQKFDDYQQTSCSTSRVSQCGFNVRYADGSSVSGDFFKDILGLGNQVVSNDYIFGCANKFVDPTPGSTSFHGSTGIMGLHGGNPVSVIDQSTNKFHKSFSYCLPTGMYNYGHLTFGPSLNSKSRFEATIPMKGGKDAEYIVALVGITVGKTRLKIAPTVFSEGALIDTGSVMTWLPKSAYDTLQAEYVKQMGEYKYSRLPGKSTEACYDLSSYPTPAQIPIPTISLHFEAGKNEQTFRISDKGVMGGPMKRRCLWFAPNEPDDDVSIIGSYAQQTFNFVFDLEKNTILVGPLGCK